MAVASVPSWKQKIAEQLHLRNGQQHYQFQKLITSHDRLLEISTVVRIKNAELEHKIFQLKQEILELQGKVATGGSPNLAGSASNDRVLVLEQKIYKLQEELTELHRTKGEHAQKIIELSQTTKAKDDLLALKESQLLDAQNNVEAIEIEARRLQSTIVEMETSSQCLRDEYQALQMAYNAMELKLRKTKEENIQLVQRWLNEKALQANKVNAENEVQERLRNEKLQQELKDASQEPVSILTRVAGMVHNGGIPIDPLSSLPTPPFPFVTSIPDRPRSSVEAHDGEVNSVRYSMTGNFLVSGGSDRKVKIWQVGRGSCTEQSTLYGCNAAVMCARFDSQEKMVLAASNDKACRIWTIGDQRLRHTLTGHEGKVLAANFLGTDSSKIVSGSHDRTLKIWDLRSKACTKTIFAGSSCNDLVTSDISGTTIISGHFDKKIRFWDIRHDGSTNEIQLPGKATSLDLERDMNYLLACSRDDSLKLIDLRRNQVVSTFKSEGFKVAFDWTRACFSPDSQYVMCGSHDGGLYVWNLKTLKLETTLREHKNAVISCTWHPSGSSLVSSDRNKHMILWTDI